VVCRNHDDAPVGGQAGDFQGLVEGRGEWFVGQHVLSGPDGVSDDSQPLAGSGRLATQLLDLDREIKDLDKQLTDRFTQHPHAEIITSVDGFGPILGAELLADTGGDFAAAFGTSARLAAYAGLAPVPRDSGRVRGNLHRPQRYHRGLRRVFYLAALSAIKRKDGPSRAFYQRKRDEGKRHQQALLTLARRLVDLVWALIRDNRVFTTEAPAPVATAA
jgi:transposase